MKGKSKRAILADLEAEIETVPLGAGLVSATKPNAQRQEVPCQHLQHLGDRDVIADVAARLAAGLNSAEWEAIR